MNNRELAIKIIEELNNRLGTRLGGVAVMLTQHILEDNAAEQSFAPDVCDARLENHEWVRRDGIEICFHCKRPRR